jgi:NTP pyrophosphatase (non-canonical NTP hydrolase)
MTWTADPMIKKISHKSVVDHGGEHQIDRCIEEMSELIQALMKERRYHRESDIENVLSELGDVIFTLHHVINAYDFTEIDIDSTLRRSVSRYEREQK